MSIWTALLLGFIQGVTEFLPVSSSGHLILLQRAFGITEGAMFFTVMLHFGTLVAVLIHYRSLLWSLIRRPLNKTVLLLVLSILPTVAIALLFKKVPPFSVFFDQAELGSYLGYCFLLTSLLLTLSGLIRFGSGKRKKLSEMTVPDALIIGTFQGIGVLPGVSRSGSTISAALFCGETRKAAADFSFLLSIPSILGGMCLEGLDLIDEIRAAGSFSEALGGIHWTCIAAGVMLAGLTGYYAIKLVLKAVQKKKLWGFAIYTALLGILVLVDQFFTHLVF